MREEFVENVRIQGTDETEPAVRSATARLSGFERTMRNLGRLTIRPVVGLVDRITSPLRAISGALGGVMKMAAGFVIGQALYELPNLLRDTVKEASEDAAAMARVQKAVENTGASWSSYQGEIDETIKRGLKLGFVDADTESALALLTAQTGSAEEAQKRYGLAMDLSRGANIDVVTASRLLGKVTDENVNVLARYGIKVRKGANETELFGAIQQKFGGQAEAFAQTNEGAMAAFSASMGQLRENIGYLLLPAMRTLSGFMVDTVLPLLTDMLLPALQDITQTVGSVLVPVFWKLVGAGQSVLATLGALWDGPLGEQARGILHDLADAVSALFQAFTSDSGALGVVGDLVEKAFGPTAANMIRPFLEVGRKVIDTVGDIVGVFKNLAEGRITVADVLVGLTSVFTGLGKTIKHEAEVLGGRLWTWFTTAAIPKLRAEFNKLVDRVKGWVTGGGLERLKTNLLKLADGAWEWLKGAGNQAVGFLNDHIIQPVKDWVGDNGPGRVVDALKDLGGRAWEWLSGVGGQAAGFLETNVLQPIRDWVADDGPGKVATALADLATKAWDWVQNAASWAGIYLGQIIDAVKTWVSQGGPQQVADALSSLALQAWDWVQNAASWASMNLMPIVTAIGDWASKTAAPALVTAGTTLGQKLYDGVNTGFQAAVTAGGLKPGMDQLSQGLDRMKVSENLNQSWINWGASLYVVNGLLTDINNTMGGTGTNFLMKAADTVMTGLVITVGLIAKGLQEASASVLAWLLGLRQTLEWFRNNPAFFDYLQKASDLITAINNPSVANVATVVKDATGGSQTTPATSATDPGGGGGAGGFPEHADGGIAVRPQLGIVGEAGPEAIVPLDQAGRFGFGGGTSFGDVNVSVSVAISANDLAGLDPDKLAKRLGPAMAREFAKQMTRMAPGVVGGVA